MTNAAYEKGRRAEYEVVESAELANVFHVKRTPGSKGAYDVLVIDRPSRSFTVWVVSVKVNDWPGPDERNALAAFHVVHWVPVIARKASRGPGNRVGWKWHLVTESGGSVPIDGPPWGAR